MEKVLLFQVQDKEAAAIAGIFAAMKVRCERIPAWAFRQTVGGLASGAAALMETPSGGLASGGAALMETPSGGAAKEQAAKLSAPEFFCGGAPEESLMIFCDVTEKHFGRALGLFREKGIRIDYKAVLTPTNAKWNVLRFYAEMAREKAEYERLAKAEK